MKKKHWFDWLWIWTILYFALGFFNILFAWLGMIDFLVPLFIGAFRRADELATAMECRCYQGGEGRTKMKLLRYTRWDFNAFFIGAGLIAAIVALSSFGL